MALNVRNTFSIPQLGVFQQELLDWTVARFAECIAAASRDSSEISSGSATIALEGWNRNRRGAGTTDSECTVTRIDSASGQPLAVLVNWPAHPTFLDAEDMAFSGDWPGHLQRTLEALIGQGVTVFYYNGAEGISRRLRDLRRDLAGSRQNAMDANWPSRSGRRGDRCVRWRYRTSPGTWRTSRYRPAAHPAFLEAGGKEYGLTAELAGPLLEQLCPTETHCTAVRLGDLVVIGVPGEMTAELGREIKSAVRESLRGMSPSVDWLMSGSATCSPATTIVAAGTRRA